MVSDCLVAGGQTVLLGDVEQTTEVAIRFQSDSDVYVILDYHLVDPAQEEYLNAVLSDEVILLSHGTGSVDLLVEPTAKAARLEEDLDVDIYVSCSTGDQVLHATFRATLPGGYAEPVPPTEEKPAEPGNDETAEGDDPFGDDVYINGDDTVIIPGITPDDGSEDEEDDEEGSSDDDVYTNEDDTVIIPGITPDDGSGDEEDDEEGSSGDDVYTNEDDTVIIPGITPDDGSEDEEDDENSSGDDVYNIQDDTVIIPGITPDGGSDDEEDDQEDSSDDDVYAIRDDAVIFFRIAPGAGAEEVEDQESADDVYNIRDDTVIIPDITLDGSEDEEVNRDDALGDNVYANGDDTVLIPGITPDEEPTEDSQITESAEPTGGEGSSEEEETEASEEPVIPEEPELPVVEDLQLNTLTVYSKTDYLPVSVSFPDGVARLELCLQDIETGEKTDLPAYTRYSADGGNSWYMLYFGGTATIDEEDLWDLDAVGNCLLFDFSATAMDTAQALCVQAVAYTETERHVGCIETYSMDAYSTMVYRMRAEELPVLTVDRPLILSERGADGVCLCVLEQLVQSRDGTAEYERVSDDLISVQFGNGVVELSVGDTLPTAGTYRLRFEYYFSGICFARSSHDFFVNYSGTM